MAVDDGCNFGTMTQKNRYETKIAVEATIILADKKRHQAAITQMADAARRKHQLQMADVTRTASDALQRQAQDHAWETQTLQRQHMIEADSIAHYLAAKQVAEASEAQQAYAAPIARARELELAHSAQG